MEGTCGWEEGRGTVMTHTNRGKDGRIRSAREMNRRDGVVYFLCLVTRRRSSDKRMSTRCGAICRNRALFGLSGQALSCSRAQLSILMG